MSLRWHAEIARQNANPTIVSANKLLLNPDKAGGGGDNPPFKFLPLHQNPQTFGAEISSLFFPHVFSTFWYQICYGRTYGSGIRWQNLTCQSKYVILKNVRV